MTSKVNDSNLFLTGTSLKKQLFSYIPHEHLKDVDISAVGLNSSEIVSDEGVAILQKVLDNSNNRLRMYGTAEDLAERLKRYREIPSSHKFFGTDIFEPYNKTVRPYANLNNKHFSCKQDLFVALQTMVLLSYPNMRLLPRSIIIIFLKTHEERLNGCHEFVPDDRKKFTEVFIQIAKTAETLKGIISFCPSEAANYQLTSEDAPFDELFEQWKTLLPGWTDEQYEPVQKALQIHCDNHPPHIFPEIYAEVFYSSKTWIELLRTIINRDLESYIPRAEVKAPKMPLTVQVFGKQDIHYVMKSELYNAINISNRNNEPLKCDDKEPFLFTMDLKDAREKFGSQIKKIEFIQIPIIKDGSRNDRFLKVSPIMTHTGDYCLPAYDAFVEVHRRSIFLRKLFQRIKHNPKNVLTEYVKLIGKYFTANFERPYFITLSGIEKIEKELDEFCKQFDNVPAKEVRNAKKNGFTLQNLENELKHLELTIAFPKIVICAQHYYGELMKTKKKEDLTTCDLYDIIEQVQKACLFERYTEVYTFMHTQNVPHAPCDLCSLADILCYMRDEFIIGRVPSEGF